MRLLLAGLLGAAVIYATGAQARPERKREPSFGPDGHIHGYLVDPAGQGLRGIVALRTPEGGAISLHHSEGGRRGRFDIDNLRPGRYLLTAESLGPVVTRLRRPEPVEVVVRANGVSRPHLVARAEP